MARINVRSLLRPRPPPQATQSRPKLTDEDLQALARTMREKYRWTADPKPFQLAGVRAQLEGVDMVIQAPTGAGKTAIAAGPHLWSTSDGKTTIMVSPLLSLEEEMVRTFKDEFGLQAVAVNSKSGACSSEVIQRIISGVYHIVLISPEMLQSRRFINRVLRNSRFSRRILSVVVDEAHCVSHWGADFRKKYGTLGIIRAFLPRGTPIIALSATLTPRVRRDLMSKLNFPRGNGDAFLNVGNDRPNVSLVVRACEYPLNTYADLDFVIPSHATIPADIPKTYLYADNIHIGTEIVDYLTARIASLPSFAHENADSDHVVRPFNANLSHKYRSEAMEKFRDGTVRILVCTDAAGMGCNVSDVDMVVQWKLPATLSNFIQRAGRAARGRDRSGIAILLVEPSAFAQVDPGKPRAKRTRRTKKGAAATTEAGQPATQQRTPAQKKAAKEYAVAHGLHRGTHSGARDALPTGVGPALNPDAPDEGLLALVQSVRCRRQIWTEVYETQHLAQSPSVPCCDICDPKLFDRARPGEKPKNQQKKQLRKRMEMFSRDHTGAQFGPKAILSDSHVEHLISIGPVNKAKLQAILGTTWVWWEEYGDKLAAYMVGWDIPYTPIPRKGRTTQPSDARELSSNMPSKRSRLSHSDADVYHVRWHPVVVAHVDGNPLPSPSAGYAWDPDGYTPGPEETPSDALDDDSVSQQASQAPQCRPRPQPRPVRKMPQEPDDGRSGLASAIPRSDTLPATAPAHASTTSTFSFPSTSLTTSWYLDTGGSAAARPPTSLTGAFSGGSTSVAHFNLPPR